MTWSPELGSEALTQCGVGQRGIELVSVKNRLELDEIDFRRRNGGDIEVKYSQRDFEKQEEYPRF